MTYAAPAIFGLPGGAEWIVIAVIALLLFGRRLPDVARSLGKSIVEFKKGIREVHDDIDQTTRIENAAKPQIEDQRSGAEPGADQAVTSDKRSTNAS